MSVSVLLLDDDPDQITITKRVLKLAGDYAVDTALDGPEGLEKMLARPYEVVLCDYRLPRMSGVEVLKQLKSHGRDIPLIIVTALGNERVAVEAMQEGAYDYVVKDNAYEDMLPGIIRRAIDRHRERRDRKRLELERDQAQAALQTSYEQLKGLLQFKDDLIAKVSHEFRTPLTSVKEGVSLLLQDALGPISTEQREYLTVIDRDIERLIELVNNILDVSKAEAGQMQLQRRQVDLHQLIDMTIQSFRPVRANRTISMDVQPGCFAFVDPHRILQVMSNLLSNAIKFTGDQGTITFRVERRDDQLGISIADDGRGIDTHDLPKLFQKFSQVGFRDPNQPRGTGLGLVVCKELVELHHGWIEVSSQPGHGTTFMVWLPFHEAEVMLTESFRELQVLAMFEKQQTIGLLAIRAHDTETAPDSAKASSVGRLAEDIRRMIHRNDVVVDMGASWVVVLAIAPEPKDVEAMIGRLRRLLAAAWKFQLGFAIYPTDGMEPTVLFEHAKRAAQ